MSFIGTELVEGSLKNPPRPGRRNRRSDPGRLVTEQSKDMGNSFPIVMDERSIIHAVDGDLCDGRENAFYS